MDYNERGEEELQLAERQTTASLVRNAIPNATGGDHTAHNAWKLGRNVQDTKLN
jgi:hypothetical protein